MLKSKNISLFSLAAAALVLAGPVSAQLQSHGPLNQYGYPESYTDVDGTTLVHGVDPADPFLLAGAEVPFLPNPAGALDIATGNFFAETFYWLGEALMTNPSGNALLVMAVEGIWQNEVVIDGDQAVMGRLRIRVALDTPGHFVVTHPYGVDEFDVTTGDLGPVAINFTIDSIDALAPGLEFTTPLDAAATRIGPNYLRWDAGAPAGYLGNPNVPHAITGSPFGTNVFRIEGPNAGGNGIDILETSLFTIVGKEAPVAPTTAWTDLGNSLPGTGGAQPLLTGTGDLTAGSQFSVDMTGAPPLSLGMLFFGTVAGNTPFAGGIIVPDSTTGFRRQRFTNASGGISFGGTFPAIIPGTELYLQFFVRDTGAVQNFTASNAIVGLVP
jgi:hypothetical protein